MNITTLPYDAIRPAPWRATHVLRPDLKLLARTMTDTGWLSPVVVRRADMTIVDGFHRWVIAHTNKDFIKQWGSDVPVTFVDVDEIDAMILHVRLNRARGQVVAKFLSMLIREVLASRKYDEDTLRRFFGMHADEMTVLVSGSLIKARKIAEHAYSKAWVPVELPVDAPVQAAVIERPPNADR
jgi:ParB-like chromosome segregation protein Spo0J